MNEQPARERDQDPEPIKHSDAQRVTGEETGRVPASEDAERDGEEEAPEDL